MRIFIGTLGVETISFSTFPVSMRSFEDEVLERENGTLVNSNGNLSAPREWRRLAEAGGHEVVEGLHALAQPAGYVVQSVYEELRDALLTQVREAGPLDIILLFMHGAMAARGYDDCEGDLLQRLRSLVGPNVVVGVEIDLHAFLTPQMVDAATAIVAFKEYPHVDHVPRAQELFEICIRAAEGEIQPTSAVCDTRMINLWRTPLQPVRGFVDYMSNLEKQQGIVSVSFIHGNPWLDVAGNCGKMLVITNGDAELAASVASKLCTRLWDIRDAAREEYLEIDVAINRVREDPVRPVVFSDVADNAGGGAPSDSTFLLKPLLAADDLSVAFGSMWDPIAVQVCFDGGVGASIDLRIGGKCGPTSGEPVDVTATVRGLIRDHDQFGGGLAPLGDAAWISCGNTDIVLISHRVQTLTRHVFEDFGIELKEKDIVVVKSTQHFYASFSKLSENILFVTSDGTLRPDFDRIRYQKNTLPYWPKVKAPFGACASENSKA